MIDRVDEDGAPAADPMPMRRTSTARSICATPKTWRQAISCRVTIEDADEHDLFGVPAGPAR